jgi:hypothetical protein
METKTGPVLKNVSAKEWNDVALYYCKSMAIIETRVVRYHEKNKDLVMVLDYPFNLFKFQAELCRGGGGGNVYSLCGSLDWEEEVEKEPNEKEPVKSVSKHANIVAQWVPDQFLWEVPVGTKDGPEKLQILCGNVIAFTLSIADAVNSKIPKLFQWNRPDAPKDTIVRTWI